MSLKRILPLTIVALTFVLLSCKKEPVEMSTLSGKWIEETTNWYKTEIEILPDGTMYTTYVNSSDFQTDTGTVEILSQALSINFNFGFGVKNGTYNKETDQIKIPHLHTAIPYSNGWFKRN